jgi:hypothetical protein
MKTKTTEPDEQTTEEQTHHDPEIEKRLQLVALAYESARAAKAHAESIPEVRDALIRLKTAQDKLDAAKEALVTFVHANPPRSGFKQLHGDFVQLSVATPTVKMEFDSSTLQNEEMVQYWQSLMELHKLPLLTLAYNHEAMSQLLYRKIVDTDDLMKAGVLTVSTHSPRVTLRLGEKVAQAQRKAKAEGQKTQTKQSAVQLARSIAHAKARGLG